MTLHKPAQLIVGALIWGLFASSAFAQTQNAPLDENGARVARMEAQMEALRRQIAELAKELTRTQEPEPKAAAPPTAAVLRAGKDGFALKSADDSFDLRLRGYIHSDSRFYAKDRQSAADTFVLRRVRPIVEGTLYRQFDFRVMPDFGEGRTVLQDAYVEARFRPSFRLRAGKFKAPVGFERLVSATEILFIERALPTALVPNRDLGLMALGDMKNGSVSYAAGVFNGVADGASADVDDQDGKDVAGRLFVLPFRGRSNHSLEGLGVGVSASYGVQRGTALTPNLPTLRSGGQQTFFRYRADLTEVGSAVADGAHVRFSTHGYYYGGRVRIFAEHVISSQDVRRATTAATLSNLAWQVAGSVVVTGEKVTSRGVTPAHVFDLKAGTWGALELTTRVNALTVDKAAFPYFSNPSLAARRALAWAGGLNWYLNPAIKIAAAYEHTTFRGGAAAGNRATEHSVFTRFQVSF